ncbi:hypothetical protein DFQ26_001647 [Actinomortierella ambigua]|nr:hypothetical protein DFQ26_001647 [Actinomortierella ambigua]
MTTKLAHQCSIDSEETNPYLAGELVEGEAQRKEAALSTLRPQFFYKKRDGAHIQNYYVGQDLSPYRVPLEEWAPVLVEGQKGFKLEASFDHVPTGYYNIVWTIQRQDLCKIKGAFQIRVIVEYEKEPWHKARYEFKHKKRSIKKALKKTGWQSLVSTERIQVHPHVGGANITVVLNRSSKVHGFGIQFQKVELKPVATTTPGRFSKENFAAPDFRVHASDDPSFEAISRLEYSREAHYLAALVILKHSVRVQVWDIRDVQDSPNENIAYRGAAITIEHKHARHLAVGMSISPSGDQIAVFQEPRIGRWEANSQIIDAEFRLRVFRNPLVSPDSVVLDIEGGPATGTKSKRTSLEMEEIPIKYSFLHKMIGYGRFVSFADQEEEEDDSLPTPRRRMPARVHARVASFLHHQRQDNSMKPSVFVSCNGYYLDVFDSSSTKWTHLQTIELSNLSPLYSRRFTCESMMELIAGDRFLWFENGNRCCSVWDIMTGTNVSHIETTPVKLNDVRGNNTLSVSPHYEYLAIAGADGSISTYMIDSGVRLDKRKFPGATIEYIGFHGNQSSDLFVFVRDTITRDLKWLILDPFQLRSERPTRAIPVPTKDGAIMASFKEADSDDRNLVCVPNGPDIEFFWTSKPKSTALASMREQSKSTLMLDDFVKFSINADKDAMLSYEIKIVVFTIKNATGSSEPRPAQGIEIYATKDTDEAGIPERVFAMVPEPWVWLDLEEDAIKQPKPLSAFFLPCKTRFVVLGSYTIQVWNMPTKTESRCTLYFYWSQPLAKPQGGIKKVQSFYRPIRSSQFHQDESGRQWISVNLGSKKYPQYEEFDVHSPGVSDRLLLLQYCVQSIYLLAVTHLFASTGGDPDNLKAFSKVSIIDFNDQARSIRRFAQDHINRTIPIKGLDIYHIDRPHTSAVPGPEDVRPTSTDPSPNLERASRDNAINPKLTSILLQLVDPDYFLVSNTTFIVAVLGSGECNWIPPQDIKLNPVLRAAKSGNTSLTQSLIDYCVLMTRKRHPYYMLSVIQSVEVLAEHFPDMLKDTFVKVSYVPALPYALSTSRIYMFRRRWNVHLGPIEAALEYFGILHPRSNDEVSRPVYQMQPHLDAKRVPDGDPRITVFPNDNIGGGSGSSSMNGTTNSTGGGNGGGHMHDFERLSSRRPASDESSRSKRAMIATMYDRQVFVAPFPCFSTYADPNSTDNRATYFSRLAGRNFFDSPAMKATLVFRSLFNFVDCLSVGLVITSNALMLVNSNRNPAEDKGLGPQQVWVVGFSILIMYLHLLFELRVIRSLGIFVNIIISITKKIIIFLILFTVLIVGFSHALLYSTHTHEASCVPGSGGCDLAETSTKYPDKFFAAVAATYFFVAGRWDPLDKELDTPSDVAFHVIMIIFLVFTVILLLNVLIAIMNMAYEECREEGELAWLKQWSQVLDEFAHIFLSPWQKQTYLPDYVYYEATTKEVMSYTEENNLANWESTSIGSTGASKMEGGKYTFVALGREDLALTMPGYSSPSGTLKKPPSPPPSQQQQQQQQQQAPPASGSTLVPSSSSNTPVIEPIVTTGERLTPTGTVIARAAEAPIVVPTDTPAKSSDSFSVQYEEYCDRYEVYHNRFDHILEEEFELLEETEDCTSEAHDQQEHTEAREKLQAELNLMQTSVQALSREMKQMLEENQIPLEGGRGARSTPSIVEPAPAAPSVTATTEPGPSVSKPSASPLSGTTTLLPRLTTSSGEGGQGYFDNTATEAAQSTPAVELTLDMVRLRELYFMTLDLENNIQQELNSE